MEYRISSEMGGLVTLDGDLTWVLENKAVFEGRKVASVSVSELGFGLFDASFLL